jgi:hypothetical protein
VSLISIVSSGMSPAYAQTTKAHDPVKIDWITLKVNQPEGAVAIDKESPILFTRISPMHVVMSSVAMGDGPLRMTSGGNAVPVGAVLARASFSPSRFCEPARRRKQNFIYCVEDTDQDGMLDSIAGVPTMIISRQVRYNYEILVGQLNTSFRARLVSPVSTTSLSPVSDTPIFDVLLTQKDKYSIALCIWRYAGNPLIDGLGNVPFCGPAWNLKTMRLPNTIAAYGGQIQLSATANGQVQARIVPPPAGLSFPN